MRRVVIAAVLLAGCADIKETYAPPAQRKSLAGPDTSQLKHFIAMTDPAADAHILRDISEATESPWRWTGQKPTLQFYLPEIRHLKFVMVFAFSQETLKQTGPVTITYFVNGRQLDRQMYSKAGEVRFEKEVDSSWLLKDSVNVASAEMDKVYVAPEDGAQLGVTLIRAGFRE
jgi:hypothetical protein